MTKKILLTAVAVGALAFAGAASAHTLTFRAAGLPATDIDAANVGPTGYRLAEEAIATASGLFALEIDLSGTSTFPSGNNIIQIDLSGGTFSSPLTASAVTAAGCTVVLSEGGGAGSSFARYLVSSAGASCTGAALDLPVAAAAGADVWVRTTLRTEGQSPIDPDTAQTNPVGNPFPSLAQNEEALQLIDRVNAFQVVVNGVIGAGALGDTFATLTVNPVYTTFFVGPAGHTGAPETAQVGQLGTVQIIVDTTARRDLSNTAVVPADVTDADVVVTGSFAAFDGAGGAVSLGAPSTINAAATTATNNNIQVDLTDGTAAAFLVDADGAPIPSSGYSAAVTYALNPTFYVQEGPVVGALESIGRDGTNVILPWMNSNSVQAANGTTNIARLGNVSTTASGPVFAQVLNSTTGVTGAPVQLFPNIAAGGERIISTAALTAALGEFGRGDIQISVESPANTITARRFAILANGNVTELSSGTVASDQTTADINDVP